MATTSPAAPGHMAQAVGNAFVEQYYHILHQSPELVYKFYQNSSVVGRPVSNGVMTSVTTMSAINEMILSLDYKDCTVEIKTVDAQDSFKDGVFVLVTGCLITKDNVRNKFTQSFFLAPQDKGYFVLNDVFRYVDENDVVNISVSVDETSESTTPIVEEQLKNGDPSGNVEEEPVVVELPVQSIQTEQLKNGDPAGNVEEEHVVLELPVLSIQTEVSPITEPAASVVQEDAPEKSNGSSIVSLIYRMSSSFRVW